MLPSHSLSVWSKYNLQQGLRIRKSSRTVNDLSRFRLPTISRRNIRFSSVSDDEGLRDDLDPGVYEMIMVHEPTVWGTSHIKRLSVPENVRRPPYAQPGVKFDPEDRYGGDSYDGDGRIRLGSEDESSIRKASKLAASTLKEAEKHIKVSKLIIIIFVRANRSSRSG